MGTYFRNPVRIRDFGSKYTSPWQGEGNASFHVHVERALVLSQGEVDGLQECNLAIASVRSTDILIGLRPVAK